MDTEYLSEEECAAYTGGTEGQNGESSSDENISWQTFEGGTQEITTE